jgi:hypothetical protein
LFGHTHTVMRVYRILILNCREQLIALPEFPQNVCTCPGLLYLLRNIDSILHQYDHMKIMVNLPLNPGHGNGYILA